LGFIGAYLIDDGILNPATASREREVRAAPPREAEQATLLALADVAASPALSGARRLAAGLLADPVFISTTRTGQLKLLRLQRKQRFCGL
jgi:hypothetical protein